MEITEHCKLPLLTELSDTLLGIVYCWMQHFAWSFPSSVQVTACQTASIVTIDNAVGVQHRYDFKNEILSQKLSFYRVRVCQEVQDPFHHP